MAVDCVISTETAPEVYKVISATPIACTGMPSGRGLSVTGRGNKGFLVSRLAHTACVFLNALVTVSSYISVSVEWTLCLMSEELVRLHQSWTRANAKGRSRRDAWILIQEAGIYLTQGFRTIIEIDLAYPACTTRALVVCGYVSTRSAAPIQIILESTVSFPLLRALKRPEIRSVRGHWLQEQYATNKPSPPSSPASAGTLI